ncbi:beta-lactamase-like protein [Mycena pura]|uniref:Beta-lactamase-like protein n=1 Tax=Mycena pura TaxID=153505 RepID=A0AAD6Y0Q0_9AGAR|nr:beta-lactamase-like protein [Mycena pura]
MRLSFSPLAILALCHLTGSAFAAFRDFGIPPSDATVSIKRFNVANFTAVNELHTLVAPILPGHASTVFPLYSYLVEHGTGESRRRLMFDLGIRKDVLNFAPAVKVLFTSGDFTGNVSKDITEQLQDGGIELESIESVIWSHSHFDHIGDMSKWPNSTSLVIGSETDTSTYPQNANASLQDSDFAGHNVTKIDFSTATHTFSGLQAIDYFGDGSVYLVNTPGHLPGHLTALARVTPTSFILLGGDTFHHAGEARPRPAFQQAFPCPAHLLEEANSGQSISTDFFWSPKSSLGSFDIPSRAQQLLSISDLPDRFTADPVEAQVSLEKVATFDADPDIFVLIAHDLSIVGSLPYFPESLDAWKENGWKEETVWNFVDKANPAFVFSPV